MSLEALNGLLSAVSIIASAIAVQLRASSRAQRVALRRLRDENIEWALYCHQLREDLAMSGVRPPEYPKILVKDQDMTV